MSMHRYANAGPNMQALGLTPNPFAPVKLGDEPVAAPAKPQQAQTVTIERTVDGGLKASAAMPQMVSNADLVRMIENVADQLSDVAAQLVDVRKRLDALEPPSIVVHDDFDRVVAGWFKVDCGY